MIANSTPSAAPTNDALLRWWQYQTRYLRRPGPLTTAEYIVPELQGAINAAWSSVSEHELTRERNAEIAALTGEVAIGLTLLELASGDPRPAAPLAQLAQGALSGAECTLDVAFATSSESELSAALEAQLRAIECSTRLSPVEHLCVRHSGDLASVGWLDELSARVPVFVQILWDATTTNDQSVTCVAVSAIAVLLKLAIAWPVPSVRERVQLTAAWGLHHADGDKAAVAAFFSALYDGKSFRALRPKVLATRHEYLLEAFERLAPTEPTPARHSSINTK